MPNTPRTHLYKSLTPIAPCKDCTDRHVGCHGKCKKYIDWKEEKDKLHTEYIKRYMGERTIEDYTVKLMIRKKR
jgi:hypothetical protein